MNWNRLIRVYTMIAGVSVVSLFVFSRQFTSARFSIAIVAVATVALVSVILGAILSLSASLDYDPSTDTSERD